jgi:AcrR family transcriptional regulator
LGRPARIKDTDLISAATSIAARLGPTHTSIAAIARKAGVPVGSVYHRYPSRTALLAEAWIVAAEAFGQQFLTALNTARKPEAAIEAALVTPRFARANHAAGVALFVHRRDDFLDEAPEESRSRAAKQTSAMLNGLTQAARRLLPHDSRGREKLAVALIGIPYGAVRVFLPQAVPPKELDAVIAAAARAAIGH